MLTMSCVNFLNREKNRKSLRGVHRKEKKKQQRKAALVHSKSDFKMSGVKSFDSNILMEVKCYNVTKGAICLSAAYNEE